MLIVFFVAVGASLRLDAVAAVGASRRWCWSRRGSGSSGSACAPDCAGRGIEPRVGDARVDRPRLAGRHHARLGGRSSPPSSRLGQPGAAAARGDSIADQRARRTRALPLRPVRSRRSRRAPAAPADRRVEPRAVPAQRGRRRPDRRQGRHRRRRRGARCADARAGGVWIAHGAGQRRPRWSSMPTTTSGCRPRARPTRCAGSGSRSQRSAALLRRLRQRRPLAALPRGGRPAEVPRGGLGGLSGRQRALRRAPSTTSSARPRAPARSSSRTTTSRSSRPRLRRAPARRRGPRSSGTSRGPTRTGCASARGGASCSRACWPTICSPFSSSATGGTSCWRSRRSWAPRSRTKSSRVSLEGRCTHGRVGADRRGLRSDPAAGGRRRARRKNSSGSGRCSASTRDIVGLGVDRLDYTKGIPERLAALDALVTRRPELRGRLTFVQIGVPSRSELAELRGHRGRDRPAGRAAQRAARRRGRRAARAAITPRR